MTKFFPICFQIFRLEFVLPSLYSRDMDIFSILKKNMDLGLTGHLNFLTADKGQFVGRLFLVQGLLVGGQYRRLKGKDAVISLCYDMVPRSGQNAQSHRPVVEPEVVPSTFQAISWDLNQLRVELHRYVLEWEKLSPLCPPSHLYLLPRFPSSDIQIDSEQFQVLSQLSQTSQCQEFFLSSPFTQAKSLEILISLRKQGLIRVAHSVK